MADSQQKFSDKETTARWRPWGIPKRWAAAVGGAALILVVTIARDSLVKIGTDFAVDNYRNFMTNKTASGAAERLETGSIGDRKSESEADWKKRMESECNAQKSKDIDAFTEHRRIAYADYRKCLAEWRKPSIFSSKTAEEFCQPKKNIWLRYSQDVKARSAQDCTALQ